MDKRERVLRAIRGEPVDHIPLMGGWIDNAEALAALAGASMETYIADPAAAVIKAHRRLQIDCMVLPIIPPGLFKTQGRFGVMDANYTHMSPESVKQDAEAAPDSRQGILALLDARKIEEDYRLLFARLRDLLGDIVYIPTHWEAVPDFMMYGKYGYESYLLAIAMYPEHVGRLYQKSAVEARFRNAVLARLYRELDMPPVLFTGHDICNNAGPLCSMAFLRKYYFPWEKHSLEPLVEAGIRVVRHCDGNVSPMLDDLIEAGYSGYQGFQYECGVDPWLFARRKTALRDKPLFFAGMNVTRTMPFGSLEDIEREIEFVLDFTDGGDGLFFFGSSSIGPEVPTESIRRAYEIAAGIAAPAPRPGPKRLRWPGLDAERRGGL